MISHDLSTAGCIIPETQTQNLQYDINIVIRRGKGVTITATAFRVTIGWSVTAFYR